MIYYSNSVLDSLHLEYVRNEDSERIPDEILNRCICRVGNQKVKDQLAEGISSILLSILNEN